MNEFTKNKIAYAVALLAALFTITPILEQIGSWGFTVFSVTLQVNHLYFFTAAFLTLAVYFYGLQFLSIRYGTRFQIPGDITYSIALAAPPFYLVAFLVSAFLSWAERYLNNPELTAALINVAVTIIVAVFAEITKRLFDTFRLRDQNALTEKMKADENEALTRARQFYSDGYYDLTIVESIKAIDLAFQLSIFSSGYSLIRLNTKTLIKLTDEQLKKLPAELIKKYGQLCQQRDALSQTDSKEVTQADAQIALATAGRIIAAIEASIQQNRQKEAKNVKSVDSRTQSKS
jgi:hypothetical protein